MNGRRRDRYWLFGPAAVLAVTMLWPGAVRADDPVPGSQGVDTSLPATPSQETVNGRASFSDLAITINQTRGLVNQAVSITWTGGIKTITSPGTFSGNFLQIMQCWGDDDGSVPSNPGPPPEQCVQGGIGSIATPPSNVYPDPYAVSRVIGLVGSPNLDTSVGYIDTRSSLVWRPFRAVDGTVVNVQTDPTFLQGTTGGNSWLNPYYNAVTTNEIAGAKTGATGTGAELFEVQTGLESSGLGCGQQVQPTETGTKVPKCWIVVVPRGSALAENAATPSAASGANAPVSRSPMSPDVWKNRIAIPIDFIPVDSGCALGRDERRLAGSELVQSALLSWQPALCANSSLPPYSFAPTSDASARLQLSASTAGGAGMVVVSRPLATSSLDPTSPVVYSPLSVSGLAIGFNIERNPKIGVTTAARELGGVRIAQLNLTPRLVAKLLTQSYKQQVSIQGPPPSTYGWVQNNPLSMGSDPDFLQFNPEFQLLASGDDRTFGGLQLPAGTSDSALQLWEWVFADPEAKAWLDGQADDWGMQVNPYYGTTSSLNPTGAAFGDPTPSNYPKGDPYCFQGALRGVNNSIVPPLLCGTDWMPYSRSYAETAKAARIAFDGARIVENQLAVSSAQVWSRSSPQSLGSRVMLSVTDTPSAARFGLQVARLSRAGDNGANRAFIEPTTDSLSAGVDAMRSKGEPQLLEADPTAIAPTAYPLTVLTYAATKPLALDAAARSDYAAFLDYASGAGQVVGLDLGQLPRGYAPLTAALQAQAITAASAVRSMVAAAPPTVDTTSPTTVPTSTAPSTTVAPTSAPASPSTPEVPAPIPPPSSLPTSASGATPATVRPVTPSSSGPAANAPLTPPGPAVVPVIDPVAAADTSVPESTVTTDPVTPSPVDPADVPVDSTPTVITPIMNIARSRYAALGLGTTALGAALGALEITKRARKAQPMPELEPTASEA